MLTNAGSFFRTYFPKLAHVDAPYPWQEQCFQDMLADRLGDSLALPTGTGKTAIMQIWLLALAYRQIAPDPAKPDIPRRLAWVVNRRVVVDQATEEALHISEALDALPENDPLRRALEKLSGGDGMLAVSTLRGQKADNGDWCTNPARAAIVVGTVDMIGSRLLFRGYGDSRYYRPSHAGLLGVDTLIVNDEAHLSPAFANLLGHIRDLAPAAKLRPKTFRVLLLSATADGATTSFEADLATNARFRSLYTAEKRLYLHEVASAKDVENRLFELAVRPGAARAIVFVEKPEDAAKMAERLRAEIKSERVALLTGTMRGYERDLLTGVTTRDEHDELAGQRAVFKQFMLATPPAEPRWLVATSAGEVGVNITSERLVSALVESDHLIQRFGRLNRFPGGVAGEAHIVAVATEKKSTLVETLGYLHSLPLLDGGARDISCRTLNEHRPPAGSASPRPKEAAKPETWLLDRWSQTTAAGPAIPPAAPWLHGKAESEAPEAEVLWREDVKWLARDGVANDDRERALEHYPVIPLERLSEPSSRVYKKLQEMNPEPADARAIVVSSDGSVSAKPIREIERADLENGRLLLPPGCGSLASGMFRSRRPEPDSTEPYDVADRDPERPRRRYHVLREEGVWRAYRIGGPEEKMELDGTEEALNPTEPARIATENALGPCLCIAFPTAEEDEPPEYLLYFKPPPRRKTRTVEIALGDHLAAVAEKAAQLAELAGLPHLKELFRCAGQYHDLGKCNELWQRAMGGDPKKPLAKTRAAPAPFLLAGFRHELESLSLAGTEEALVLHLVASHHGWARPHFEPKAYSRETLHRSREAALAAARRFGELQAAWGHWGLAYLEAVFKAADAMASEAEQEGPHA